MFLYVEIDKIKHVFRGAKRALGGLKSVSKKKNCTFFRLRCTLTVFFPIFNFLRRLFYVLFVFVDTFNSYLKRE